MRVLITGAAAGLGLALTQQMLDAGAEVVAVDRDIDALEDRAAQNRGNLSVHLCDLSVPSSIARLLDGLTGSRHARPFDLVILNAGISATGAFEDIPVAAYQKLLTINLRAPIALTSQLVAKGAMAKKGKFVFISSLSHAVGYPGAAVYAASKDGIAAYARSIRKPLKKKGLGVLTVFPGPVRTAHADRHAPKGAKAEKRMPPEKLAALILKAAKGRSPELYPGTSAYFASIAGTLAPEWTTKAMKKVIYDKLDGPVY
ncbi:MAG: SDR family NAD(P)-dependent oxidoreductase [Pseudomonadota bacterium]